MRAGAVGLVFLVGCGGPVEFRHGMALGSLGDDPLGGSYNPDLAGCSSTESSAAISVTTEWDDRGRMSGYTYEQEGEPSRGEVVFVWDGPCITSSSELSELGGSVTEFACDDQGWAEEVSGYEVDADGGRSGEWVVDYELRYEGGELREMSGNGMSATFEWSGNRMVSSEEAYDGSDGSVLREHVYTDDGWIATVLEDGATTHAWQYDPQGRAVSMVGDGDRETEWVYADDDARWPVARTDLFRGASTEVDLAYDCD